MISALRNSFEPAKEVEVAKEAVTPAPVYRFLPEIGFTNYNKVSYQPRLEIEVPAPINYEAYPATSLVPITSYAPISRLTSVAPAAQIVAAESYGQPAEVYGPPA